MGGNSSQATISTSETRLGALQVQQSSYGLSLPIIYGQNRVAGNLLWYGDFVAIATTTTTVSGGGGKGGGGGGVRQQDTKYTYEAAVAIALAEGVIGGIVSVWRGKERITIDPLSSLGFSFFNGSIGQAPWGHLATNHPTQALGYSQTAYVAAANYALTTNAELYNHTFEVIGKMPFGSGILDANPADIIYDLLTNTQYGAGFPESRISGLVDYSNYCRSIGLFISPVFSEQEEVQKTIQDIVTLTNSSIVWSEGLLKIAPLGDESATGNGATYTPNIIPIYDLSDNDYIVSNGDSDPIVVKRMTPADSFNQIQLEFLNRNNAYNIEIVEAKDQANIEAHGLRPKEPIKAHQICDIAVARNVAQLLLQRELYVRNTYSFKLGWKYAILEPMDLVTVTDLALGLNKKPIKITMIEEDESGLLSIEAEDYPFGVSSATLYPSSTGQGYSTNYNVDPGDVYPPAFIEPPIELTTGGLQVWVAVTGTVPAWGGCNIWLSLDNISYTKFGAVHGGARYGTLTAPLSSGTGGTLSVQLAGLGGQMFSATSQEAELLESLCFVSGGAGGEYLAHETATLTGPNAYTLTGLVRGAYTTKTLAKITGATFVRADKAITKSGELDWSLIGKTIYFKFTSFNVYGGGEQALASVTDYPYTITGSMLALPPVNVDTFDIVLQRDGTRQFNWAWTVTTKPLDLKGYKLRYRQGTGWGWDDMRPLDTDDGFFTASPHETNILLAGFYTFAIKTIDKFGNESESAKFIESELSDQRLGRSLFSIYPNLLGWPGIKTNCHVEVDDLWADNQSTWATLPATWANWTAWASDPQPVIQYEHPYIDVQAVISIAPVAVVDADGAYLVEVSYSADNITWSAWAQAGPIIVARYIKFRITVTGAYPHIRALALFGDANLISEALNNQVVSPAALGVKYLGVGDINVPLSAQYSLIKEVVVSFQGVNGNWGYDVVDKNDPLGPHIKFYNPLNALADPPAIDVYIKGFRAE